MKNLFLDDKRVAPDGYVLVKSVRQCIEYLERNAVARLSLDYNLGKNKPKGYRVALYMVRRKKFPPHITIHSNSPRGRMKMYRLLARHKPKGVSLEIRPLPTPLK
ncbi:cyclic-phosphate processing receiver domain-containing protein [Cohnella candidum]|uniref:Cell division protein FtsJ n=1 Tax=Cohnella candidum TaxID=2674991 RepID=A0A3G3JYM2_9BACL|nr:cyclic-phosphate processing receiver domain-containing protein [Cohnella candidum]AYQ73344.1 cell division protein FtsJ [Cohnella candidum]